MRAIYGLGNAVTEEDGTLTGVRLPTCRQVLRCLMWQIPKEIEEGKQTQALKWKSASIVLNQLKTSYAKANIPMLSDHQCCKLILDLFIDNNKLRQIPVSCRDSPNSLAKLQSMNESLDKTFGVWKKDALTMIKHKKDQIFLESMKSNRAASFGGVDKKRADQDCRKAKRLQKETSRQECHEATKELEMESHAWSDNSASSDNLEEREQMIPEHQKKRSHHRSTYAGTRAFIPHDILKRPTVVSVAARLNITPLQQTALTKAVIEEAGGDPRHVAKSYSTADKA